MLLSTPGARDTRHEHPAHTAASQARPALETQATNENSCGVEWPAGWPPGCRRHRGQTPPPQPARPRSQRPAPDALPRGRLAGVPHLPARGAPPPRAPGRVSGAPPGVRAHPPRPPGGRSGRRDGAVFTPRAERPRESAPGSAGATPEAPPAPPPELHREGLAAGALCVGASQGPARAGGQPLGPPGKT